MRANLVSFMTKLGDRYFELSRFLQFALWFGLIFLIKFDTLFEPPVWDAAMGVFPPAIFLYETNFDVLELVKQPDWWEGGANVHSFSLWTWFIALVMSITHSPTVTFAVLHITTFAINALALSVFVRILFHYKAGPLLALISGLFLMLIPLVLVQIGYIYTESLVMSLGILAWASWYHEREARAVLFAILAIGVKLTGAAIAFCLIPLLIIRLLNRFSLKRLMLLISIPLALLFFISIDSWLGELPSTHGMEWGGTEAIFKSLKARLYRTPEITYFILLSAIAGFYFLYRSWRMNNSVKLMDLLRQSSAANESKFLAIIFAPLFIFGIIAMCYSGKLFLSRYIIPTIPFAVIQLVLLAQLKNSQRMLGILYTVGCALSVANHNGAFYNSTNRYSIVAYAPSAAFSVVETSHAYQPYMLAQKTIAGEVEKLANELPIYVSREMLYLTSNPMMGYVTKKRLYIHGIFKPQYEDMALEDFPDRFYIVRSYHGHGGLRLEKLIEQADQSEDWDVEDVYEQDIGGYEMHISHVCRIHGHD